MPENSNSAISSEQIAAAEKLLDLDFSGAQREQMRQSLNERLTHYSAIRGAALDNDVPMPLHFNVNADIPQPADVLRDYATIPRPDVARPQNLEDAAFYSVTQLAELLRTRQVTSLELTEMYLGRLKRYDTALECVACYTEELACEQASRADDELARGLYRGPLHGIPWGAKDLLATRGYPTGWGATPFKDQVIDVDATVVRRLADAGAVLIAKLTLGALANGDVWHGGTTRNPWDTSQGSSGSSAGSAAATAAGLVGFSIGTETLGSIVSPSTRCGVTGLRPTFGRVSRYGAMALSWSMDKIGPMCRGVEDCALVFSAIYGPDGRDLSVTPQAFQWDAAREPRDLRVAFVDDGFQWDDETYAAAEPNQTEYIHASLRNGQNVLDVMRELGFDLFPIALPQMDMDALSIILKAEAAAAFDAITRDGRVDTMVKQDDSAWPNTFRAARFIPAVEYINANRMRTELMRNMAQVMREVDVFIVPSLNAHALQITNFTGHPTVVLPNGFCDKGRPTGISFIGGLYQEAETLAVAKAYQEATDWRLRHPNLDAE